MRNIELQNALDRSMSGLQFREEMKAAAALGPERIVYISCNPKTQARDVRQLVGAGYIVRAVRPVDMFPHTDHVESIVMLERSHD